MSWSITCLVNEVLISNECRDDLFEASFEGDEIWGGPGDVIDTNGHIWFSPDHMENMDCLRNNPKFIDVLTRYEVEGDICFVSMEGDNKGQLWGYRFDGQGGMKKLKGRIVWGESPRKSKRQR